MRISLLYSWCVDGIIAASYLPRFPIPQFAANFRLDVETARLVALQII
jgi:hypothetical protein